MNRLFEPRHLRRKAKQKDARVGHRLVLQPIERFLAQTLQQGVVLDGYLAHHIARFVGGLKSRAPDLLAALLVQIAEIFHEPGDEVALGEQRIDREIDLQALMQLEQARADRVRMRG